MDPNPLVRARCGSAPKCHRYPTLLSRVPSHPATPLSVAEKIYPHRVGRRLAVEPGEWIVHAVGDAGGGSRGSLLSPGAHPDTGSARSSVGCFIGSFTLHRDPCLKFKLLSMFKSTVRPDWICVRVVPLDRP